MTTYRGKLARCLAATIAVVTLQACRPAAREAEGARPPQVSVVVVQRRDVPVAIELPGRTSAFLVAQVRARVDGIVQKRAFQEGAEVKDGQSLYRIDPAPFVAALDSSSASLRKAQATLASTASLAQRYAVLVESNAVSKQDFDNSVAALGQAEADVMMAKAAVATARINLGYTNVTSPIKGRTGLSAVTPGGYVQANAATLMTTVQQIDPIYVDLNQSSAQGLELRRRANIGKTSADAVYEPKVTLYLEDGSTYPVAGKLQFTDITVNQGTGSVTLRAVFPNPREVLLPGMFVRARIESGLDDSAFLVPQVGVTHDPQGHASALVVGSDNKVAQRMLKLRGTQGNNWIVESGLEDGERVIVAGLQSVRPGLVVQLGPPAAAASGTK